MPTLTHYLILGSVLFVTGVAGIFLNRKNVLIILMSMELMLLAVNMNFLAFAHFRGDIAGQVFVFFVLTVAAAESAIGTRHSGGRFSQPPLAQCGRLGRIKRMSRIIRPPKKRIH